MALARAVSTVLVILAAFPACQSTVVGNFATSPSSVRTPGFVNSLLPLRQGPQPATCIQRAREPFVVGRRSLQLRQPAALLPKLNQRAKQHTGPSMLLFDSFDGDAWDEYDEMDVDGNYRVVLLRDTNSDRVIECFVDREMEVDGKKYATLLPVDTPVILAGYAEVNGTNQLVPVLEDGSIDELFPTAAAVLAEMDLSLSRSAVVLTVEGRDHPDDHSDEDSDEDGIIFLGGSDQDEDSEEEAAGQGLEDMVTALVHGKRPRAQEPRTMVVGLKVDELVDRAKGEGERGRGGGGGGDPFDASEEDEEDDEDSNEKVQVLATFYQDGKKYVVAAPLEPVLIIGAPASKPADVTADVGRINELNSMLGGALEEAEPLGDVEYLLPEREELERVTPRIEAELETLWDEEEKERKGISRMRQRLISQWVDDGEVLNEEDNEDDEDDHT